MSPAFDEVIITTVLGRRSGVPFGRVQKKAHRVHSRGEFAKLYSVADTSGEAKQKQLMQPWGFCPTCKPLHPPLKRVVNRLSSLTGPRSRLSTRCSLTSGSSSSDIPEMSSYLPSLKWPSFGSQTRTTSPEDDAPLSALPPSERTALDALIELAVPIVSHPLGLPECDPWKGLNEDEELRDRVLMRLLRFNGLSATRAARQLETIVGWRAKSRIAEQPCDSMYGMEAGIPISLLDSVGEGGARLFFAQAEHYVKKATRHAVQEVGVARMFEYMLYDADGPKAERCNVVVDFTGFSSKNVDLVGMKTGVSTYMNYYPDVFHKILLINYPKFLYGVWRVICPLLDERTASRVIWLSDGESLRNELEGTFAKRELPWWLGGDERSSSGMIKLLNGVEVEGMSIAERFS